MPIVASSNHDFKTYLQNAVNSTKVLYPVEIFNTINFLNPHKACKYNNISAASLLLGN